MNRSFHKDRVLFNLSLTFSLILILSNLVAASRLVITSYFTIPGGLILYPATFVISNIVNEVFGPEKTRRMVLSAFAGNIFSLVFLHLVSFLPASSPDIEYAWHTLFDISPITFIASFVSFSVSQQLEILSFSFLKRRFPTTPAWLRNNTSTLLSQMIDTFIVDFGVIYLGMHLPFTQTLHIMMYSYFYKVFFNILTTPVFYIGVRKSYASAKIM
ncbi:queuosine precursor transporter [Chlamydia abortus]|uniref:queuosine precursor transporter n=1 Tax=Chlamydia abortus TaxID=83555 RepID=UPI00192B3650|nr:queuosine precursor transporter [Chlamydia abortus]CAD7584047.1 Putative preQ0 transporter YhhQ [Chlamydia abortus]CAG9045907.1 queuosine precursor transporter [Chlamydia abortus]